MRCYSSQIKSEGKCQSLNFDNTARESQLKYIFSQSKKRGISLETLAKQIGVSVFTLSRWRTGKNKPSHLAEKGIEKVYREFQNAD